MRRLLILTAAAAVTASASGCFHWFNRGGSCGGTPAYTTPGCATPTATYSADPYMAPPAAVAPPTYIAPGPQG